MIRREFLARGAKLVDRYRPADCRKTPYATANAAANQWRRERERPARETAFLHRAGEAWRSPAMVRKAFEGQRNLLLGSKKPARFSVDEVAGCQPAENQS